MKGTMKILSVLMIAIMLVAVVSIPVHATSTEVLNTLTSNISGASGDVSQVSSMAGKVIKWIRNVAVIAGVILLTVIGFKYMLGSAEEKADYKKSLIPLVVGIIVVMAATQLMTMIMSFLE